MFAVVTQLINGRNTIRTEAPQIPDPKVVTPEHTGFCGQQRGCNTVRAEMGEKAGLKSLKEGMTNTHLVFSEDN